jgi:hypothetical protein
LLVGSELTVEFCYGLHDEGSMNQIHIGVNTHLIPTQIRITSL